MNDFTLPAYPTFPIDGYGSSFHGILPNGDSAWCSLPGGFTKLEVASLMIAQGIMARGIYTPNQYQGYVAEPAVAIARAVLEEANK